MNKRNSSRKNSSSNRRKKAKIKILIITSIILSILIVAGFTTSDFLSGNLKAEAGENEPPNKENNSDKDKDKDKDEDVTPKLDNSGYLLLGEDPNADDAKVVSDNLQGLLKGEKQFPVRHDGKKVVYLTFDDGPSTNVTPKILNILNEKNVKGTFFVLGNTLVNNIEAQEVLKRTVNEGHAIANHSYSHDYKKLYPNRTVSVTNFMNDIEKCNDILKDVLGKDFHTEVVRFPGGYWSWNGREQIKKELDNKEYHIMEWNALTKDSEGAPKTANQMVNIVKEQMDNFGPKADEIVLLMHDINSKEETAKALPQIIEYYKSLGFEFRTMK